MSRRPYSPDITAILAAPDPTSPAFLALADWFWPEVDRSNPHGCWPWTGCVKCGYGQVVVRLRGKHRGWRAHRLAFLLDRGYLPGYLPTRRRMVTHVCGNSLCCRPDHLEDGNAKSNADDRERHGRTARGLRSGRHTKPERTARGARHGSHTQPERLARGERHSSRTHPEILLRGEDHPFAQFTPDHIRLIRALAAQGVPNAVLAAQFGCTVGNISAIVRRRTWKHVEDAPLLASEGVDPASVPLQRARRPPRRQPRVAKGDDHYSRRTPERLARGTRHASARLTDEDIPIIVRLGAQGLSRAKIAPLFDVHPMTIHRVLAGESWRHVTERLAKEAADEEVPAP